MKAKLLKGLLLTLVFLLAVPAIAQETSSITGRVLDPSGATVVGAQITVVNTATNIQNSSVTNEEGMYRISSLRPGSYRLTVSAAGFKKLVREGVDLRMDTALAINAALEMGALSETVEVSAATPLLETETSSTGQVVEGNFFYSMPLFQRNSKSSMYLTPGVTVGSWGYAGYLNNFHINGESDSRIGFFSDGTFGVATPPGGSSFTTDPIGNSVDEIKVLTTSLSAEYGHSAGGAISVVTKGGTNQLHGLASEFGRYGGMSQRRYFDKYKLTQPQVGLPNGDSILFEQPDGNISGPVYLPKIYDGRNKTFFRFAVERLIQKQGTFTAYSVPTPEVLAGNFTFAGSGVTPQQIYDPRSTTQLSNGAWTRQPFAGNVIPTNQFDPVMVKFLSFRPWSLPNATGTPSTTGPSNNFLFSYQKRNFWENYAPRLDHQVGSKLRTFATWTYNSRFERIPQPNIANALMFDSSLNKAMYYQNTVGLGGTYVLSPTLISDTHISYYRYSNPVASIAYGKNYAGQFGIPNVDATSMPGGFPISVGNPSVMVQETFNFKEDVSKTIGTHAFKMGYDMLRLRQDSWTKSNTTGSFSFTGCNGLGSNGSSTPNTGNSWCNYWVGSVASYTTSVNLLTTLPRDWIHSLYIQDDWKVLPNLTANLGVRWMVESQPNNKYGQQSNFDPAAPDNTAIGSLGVITHPTGSMYKRDWNNFQPRVGIAWNARKNIVIRAGFAVNTVDMRLQSPPTTEYGSISLTQNRPSGNFYPMFQISQGPNMPLQWPATRADGSIPFSGSNYSSRSATVVNPRRVNPYSMNWNFGAQYGLGKNYLLELSYTGNRSVKGFETWETDGVSYAWAWNLLQSNPTTFSAMEGNSQPYRPFTNFGSIGYQGQGANAVFHSGTIKIEKRYSYGLSLLAFYIYGKSIDDSSSNIYIARSMDRARSSFDRTHQFTGSMNYEIPIGKGRHFMNRGGILNVLLGGYDMVWMYMIGSGNPVTFGMSGSPYKYMPGIVAARGGRPDSNGVAAHLRSNWQDLGGDRYTPANQNKMIDSMSDFTYPAAYTQGNVGRDTMDAQRLIAASFSASKEVKIKERLTFQLRYDFQNPFKWYNLGNPNTTVNFPSPATFGTVSVGSEATGSNYGGWPIENITLALKF